MEFAVVAAETPKTTASLPSATVREASWYLSSSTVAISFNLMVLPSDVVEIVTFSSSETDGVLDSTLFL